MKHLFLLEMWRTLRVLEVTGLIKQVPVKDVIGMRALASSINVIKSQPYY